MKTYCLVCKKHTNNSSSIKKVNAKVKLFGVRK